MKSLKKIKESYHKLLHSHATPKEVAQGFALGVFISMTPTMGLHSLLALGLAAILKKNEIAAFIGVWVTNPLTAFPIYLLCYKIGTWVILSNHPKDLRPESMRDLFHLSGDILIPLWVGGILFGILSAILSYYIVLKLYPYIRRRKELDQKPRCK